MSLKQRVDRLGGTRTVTRWPDGLSDILTHEDWLDVLEAEDPTDAILRRCPNYLAIYVALRDAKPDRNGIRRVRI